MVGLLFLIGSFLLGIGLIKKVFPFADGAERFFWGIAVGIFLSTWSGYLICRILFEVNYFALIILTIIIWASVVFLFRKFVGEIRHYSFANTFRENKYLILLLSLFIPIFFYFFYVGMFRAKDDGLYLTATSWYDLALHLAISNSFLYGQNFPPMYMVIPDEPLRYPFLPDFHAAIFLKLGWSIWASFAVTSFASAIALIGTFYCFARRLADSKSAAFIATLFFLFNGGLGFILFFRDWYSGDKSLIGYFFDMKENYTDMLSQGIKWVNLITSGVIPQRAMLYGMPVAFVVLALISIVWRDWSESADKNRWSGARILFAAGVITGMLPLYHVHSYMSVGLISGFLFLVRPRFAWLVFWLPAVLLALPQMFGSGGHLSSSEFLQVHLGWMSYAGTNFFVFLLFNFGLPLLLIVPALFAAPRYLQTFYIPFVALIILCFVFRISPNDFDNVKLMYYWHAATAVVIAVWLNKLSVKPKLRFWVVLIILACTASGVLATVREAKIIYRIFSSEEIEAGIFSREQTAPDALFLTGQYHNQPALCLAGRRILLGYDFWIISHGYSRQTYDALKEDVKEIYKGSSTAEGLLEKHKIDYIYVGPNERKDLQVNEDYLNNHHTLVFNNATISIYKIQRLQN